MTRSVQVHRLGLLPYHDAWDWQRRTAGGVREGAAEAIGLLQHPPVYTFGRRVHRENLLVTPADADVVESDRGGDVTYHGPGQLVAYPILDLRRRNLGAADYVRLLEEAMIRTAAAFAVEGGRIRGRPGVWVNGAKLGAVGVHVQGGVATHGLALNVSTDLSRFDAIVPCGLAGISVTSVQRELGYAPAMAAVEDSLLAAFAGLFDCSFEAAPNAARHTIHRPQPLFEVGEGRSVAGVRLDAASGTDAFSTATSQPRGAVRLAG